jgi:hypothetical protein
VTSVACCVEVAAAALGCGRLPRTQTFLDQHLNRWPEVRRDAWPDFPTRAIAALAQLPFRPDWEPLDR